MAELFELQELRVRYPGTTYSDTFTAANDGAWGVGTATQLAHVESVIDVAGLTHPRLPNTTVQTRRRSNPAGVLGLRKGTFSFSCYMGSNDGTGQDAVKTLLYKIYGGLSTPSADSAVTTTSSTTTVVQSTGIGAKVAPGSAVLVGTRGDGDGEGEVRVIAAEDTDEVTLTMALQGAPAESQTLLLSHTVYPAPTTAVEGLEFLIIGADDSPDQLNCIGCTCTAVSFGNLDINDGDGQLPIVTFEISVGDYRYEPAGTKATMSTTTSPQGPDPAMDRGIGGFFISDRGAYSAIARGYMLGGKPTIDPDCPMIPIKSPLGANGIGGWVKGKGSVKWGFTALLGEGADTGSGEPIPSLTDDHANGTAKQIVFQFGHAAGAFAIDIQKAYIDARPSRADLDGLAAVTLEGHGTEDTDQTESALLAADHRIHFFHTAD